ncbi:MAG: hypothetical protein R3C58_00120 [Parvularculaceae bacterium]
MTRRKAAMAAFAASLIAAGAALAARPKPEDVLAKYEKTGEMEHCIRLRSIRDTDILDDYTMMFTVTGGAVYLNELNGRCPSLYREQRYFHKTTTSDMCRGDIIQSVDSFGNMIGGCSLGDFERLEKLPPPAE